MKTRALQSAGPGLGIRGPERSGTGHDAAGQPCMVDIHYNNIIYYNCESSSALVITEAIVRAVRCCHLYNKSEVVYSAAICVGHG